MRRFFDRIFSLFDWLDGTELVLVAGAAALFVVLGPLFVVYRFVLAHHYVVASALMLVWSVCIAACVRDLRSQAFNWISAIILRWLGNFKRAPKGVFIVHGEPAPRRALREKIVRELGWKVILPEHFVTFDLK